MSPTLTIPSVPPAPRAGERAGEPAGSADADGEGGAAFADALQRARGERRPAHGNEPRATASKPAHDRAHAHAQATRGDRAPNSAPDTTAQPDGDAACRDSAGSATEGEPADAAPRSDALPDSACTATQPPMITLEAAAAALPAVDPQRGQWPRAADTDDSAPTLEERPTLARAGARNGGTHDLRAGPGAPACATQPAEPPGTRDGAATSSLHAAIEQASIDATAAAPPGLRLPSIERPAEPSATPLAAALFARGAAAAVPGADARLPQATLHAAIDDAGFGAALGTQVSLWVRDGVQEARLQLHPAELGPVTVQITLEGQAAHVDFTAAVAATRESIEQSLPALAAALRESGFTLTGGGVASHGGQGGAGEGRRERTPADPAEGSRHDDGGDTPHAAHAPRRWTRSLLDVYA